jgi:hypothetical protein
MYTGKLTVFAVNGFAVITLQQTRYFKSKKKTAQNKTT